MTLFYTLLRPNAFTLHDSPRACKLRLFPILSHALPVTLSLTLPNLVTIGGSLIVVVFVNILKSGLWASLGGGGLGGALVNLSGGRSSGNKISESEAMDVRDAAGDVGVDIDRWIRCKGSFVMCGIGPNDSADS